MKIKPFNFLILVLFTFLFSCQEEKNPFLSKDLEKTLNVYLKKHKNIEQLKMVEIEFSKWENKCSLIFTAYSKTDNSKKSSKYKGKMIVFYDEKDCSKGFINSSFINKKSVRKIVLENEKLDTLKSVYPMSVDFYHFDVNNKIQYSPNL